MQKYRCLVILITGFFIAWCVNMVFLLYLLAQEARVYYGAP